MDEELLRVIDLFDEDEVMPASQMKRPQQALDREMFDDFMKRNPVEKADGGRIPFNFAGSVTAKKQAAEKSKKLKDFVAQYKLNNDGKLPRQIDISRELKTTDKTIKKYLTKGKDYVLATEEMPKRPLKVKKEIDLRSRPGGGFAGKSKEEIKKIMAERSMPGKDAKDAKFKDLTDKIFKSDRFDLFKAEVTEAQKRFAAKTGKVRKGTGVIPAQYIKQFNKAIEAGVNSPEFKEILRITGRTEDEILELNKKRPGGKVTIKVRAKAAEESYPEERKLSDADRKFKQKQIAKVRREREKAALKFASEADRQDLNAINKGKQFLNKFFKNNPEAINNTDFGKQIKAMMSLRFSKDGKISSKVRPDDYYVSKAKEGKLFDLFDVSPVAGEKRAIRFPTNLNITPGQFNQTFIQQVQKYFLKNDNPEALKQVDDIFKRYNIRVEIPGKGRIGAAADVAVDRSKGDFPRILNTLNSLKIPNKLKIPFIATGTIIGTAGAGAAAAADASEARSILPEIAAGTAAAGTIGTKPGRKLLGKAFRTLGTPLSGSLLAANQIRSNIQSGENVVDAVVDPLVGLELSFPGLFKENIAKITKNPTAQKILKLGKFGRVLTPIGAGITAAGLGIDAAKFTKKRLDELRAMTPEQRTELRSQGARQAFDPFQAAGGGIAKLAGIDEGPQRTSMNPDSQGLSGLLKRVKKG